MNNSPLVSIVIPVYNGSDYLAEAIDSALAQTYDNIEVMVINDGSKDNGATRNIALGYGDRIRYFEKENGGVASALNHGLREMKGEYFSWLSHDDVYYENKIEKQINDLIIYGYPYVLYSDYEIINEYGKNEEFKILPVIESSQFRYWLASEVLLHGCTLLIPRKCFDKAGYFDEDLITTQDYTLWNKFLDYYQFRKTRHVLVKSRRHKSQTSNRMQTKVIEECNVLQKNFFDSLIKDKFHIGNRESLKKLVIKNLERGYFKSSLYAFKKMYGFESSFISKIKFLIQFLFILIIRFTYSKISILFISH